MMEDGIAGVIEGARSAAGLVESAVRVAVETAAVKWCAFLVAGDVEGQWQVIHGGGSGAPEAGSLLTADDLTALDEGDAESALYFRAAPEQLGPGRRTGIVFARPTSSPETPVPHDPLHDALDGFFGHVQALWEHLPGHAQRDGRDGASGLANVPGLMGEAQIRARLDEEVARARRYGGTLSVLLIDVDETGTPELEETVRTTGNVVRRQVQEIIGKALVANLRLMDCSGHFGPDGYLVVLPETGAEEALGAGARFGRIVGQAIEEHVAGLDAVEAPAFELRCGVTTFPVPAQSTAELLEQAAAALKETRTNSAVGWLRHALPHLNDSSGRGFRCICRRCGKVFEVDDRAHQRARRFCSHTCYVVDRRESERGRDEQIREARGAGASLRELARRFNLSPERVRQICQPQLA
jgi:diguanylate cyclase (GGDEF)-like protein